MADKDNQGRLDTGIRQKSSSRLLSLDALRGFDMLWIVGLDQLVRNSAKTYQWPPLQWLAGQMTHPAWKGFTLYDLIFPLFLFIVGVAIPFSLNSQRKRAVSTPKIYLRITIRLFLLLLLGVIYNGGLSFSGYENTRFGSVLGFIGVGYFFAAIIVMNCSIRAQIAWFLGILLGYWAAVYWIPVPNVGAGVITPEGSLATYIDQMLMPGRLHSGPYDPQGILPCISGVSTALAGAITGYWLRRENTGKWIKALGLLIGGLVCVGIGVLWGQCFPIIKNLWSGSFVLLTAGLSLLLLTLFYTVIDCIGLKKWAIIFIVVGVNPITIYMANRIIHFGHTANFMFSGLIQKVPQQHHSTLYWVSVLLAEWLFLYFLYRKKIFFKV